MVSLREKAAGTTENRSMFSFTPEKRNIPSGSDHPLDFALKNQDFKRTKAVKNTEFKGVDLFKLIFSFFVVFIHCHPKGDVFFVIANGPGRLAVPFFFAAAGYFLTLRIKDQEKAGIPCRVTLFAYLKRLLKMYILWSAIYLPFTLSEYIVGNGWTFWRCVIEYTRAFFVTGTFTQLWYLPALITAVLLTVILCRRISPKWVFVLGIFLYVFGTFDEAYSGLCPAFLKPFFNIYNPIFQRTRTGLFFGFVYVTMGYILACKESIGRRVRLYGIFTALFTVLASVEGYLLNEGDYSDHFAGGVFEERYGMYLMLIPATFFCLQLSLSISPKFSQKTAIYFRKCSTLIYLSHQFFNGILIVLLSDYLLKLNLTDTIRGFFIVLTCSILFSVLTAKIGKGTGRAARVARALS